MIKFRFLLSFFFIFFIACKRLPQGAANEFSKAQPEEKVNGETQKETGNDTLVFPAEIIRVVDGDTAEMLYHDLTIKIRMAHIDAPESRGDQPYGLAAKEFLKKLCENKTVTIRTSGDFGGFGRLIAVLETQDGLNINKEMVRRGYAWHLKKYSKDQIYANLETQARKAKRGLWQQPHPQAPWDFRKR